ncbi:hypothetical protein KSP35_11275 [Aquihabitans sp. G128]|uniref:hypothetical protein n=1 Tax=Aquihabitans sp. G128 TaxID=2849779 RepID=UPI001C22D9A4|nr:hypothetical protein [Aquihabitans sp. G128]QXC63310.1 hypothetical protein KSP35_11275 [Aquihabitans sp. G128]
MADGLRGDDITLLTIALAKDLSTDSQAFLGAVTTGRAGSTTCGRPVDTPPGSYLAAADVDVLIARFDEVAARVAGGTLVPSATAPKLCGDTACDEGTRTVKLDASVRRLRVFALAPQPGMVVQLTGPGGTARVDAAGTTDVGGVTARTTEVAGRGFAIELDRPADDAAWDGSWKVSLLDPTGKQVGKAATLQLYLFSELGVRLTEQLRLVRGEQAELSASLVAPKGIDVKELVASGAATLRLEDPVKGTSSEVDLAGPPQGPYTGTFTPPKGYRSSSYLVSLELRATTRDGAAVVARSATTPAIVRRPEGAIQFAPDHLVLPTLTGAGSTSAELTVAGGKKDGCIWFGPAKATAPDEAGALTVRYDGRDVVSQGSCIQVAAGALEVVTVEVDPAKRATGAVRGVLEVHEKTAGTDASVTDVPYQLDLAVGIDQARRLILAVLLLLGGIALPLAVLLVLNAVTARFQSLDAVQGAVLPVRVSGASIYRTDSSRPASLTLRPSDFSSLRDTGDVRRFTFGGIEFRARAARNPFGVTAALAAPAGGAERLKGGAGSKVALDPSLSGSWIFLLDPDRTRRAGSGAAEGNLIAFVAEGELRPQLERLLPDVSRRLPDTAADLAGLVRSKKAKRRRATTTTAAGDEPGDEAVDEAIDPTPEAPVDGPDAPA